MPASVRRDGQSHITQPVFPAMFIGAAAGIAASHLPGLDVIPAAAMGIGAMCR